MRHIRLLAAALLLFVAPLFVPLAHAQFASSGAAFQPFGKTLAVAASNASATGTLAIPVQSIQIYNATTAPAFVNTGISCTGLSASTGSSGTQTSDYPVGPGAVVVITVPANTVCIAVILGSSSGLVYFTPGLGL